MLKFSPKNYFFHRIQAARGTRQGTNGLLSYTCEPPVCCQSQCQFPLFVAHIRCSVIFPRDENITELRYHLRRICQTYIGISTLKKVLKSAAFTSSKTKGTISLAPSALSPREGQNIVINFSDFLNGDLSTLNRVSSACVDSQRSWVTNTSERLDWPGM